MQANLGKAFKGLMRFSAVANWMINPKQQTRRQGEEHFNCGSLRIKFSGLWLCFQIQIDFFKSGCPGSPITAAPPSLRNLLAHLSREELHCRTQGNESIFLSTSIYQGRVCRAQMFFSCNFLPSLTQIQACYSPLQPRFLALVKSTLTANDGSRLKR